MRISPSTPSAIASTTRRIPCRFCRAVGRAGSGTGGSSQGETILDYGCGPSRGISRYLTHDVRDYDPGVETLSAAPKPADLVICDPHVRARRGPESLDAVMDHLRRLARKAIFVVVSCEASSSKVLPDGTPWHTLVHDATWWAGYLKSMGFQGAAAMKEGGKEYAALLEINS